MSLFEIYIDGIKNLIKWKIIFKKKKTIENKQTNKKRKEKRTKNNNNKIKKRKKIQWNCLPVNGECDNHQQT